MIRSAILAEKAVAKAATKAAAKPAASAAGASAAKAPSMSTEETTMPWEGWFTSFLKDKLGEERFESLRRSTVYMPDDPHSLHQAPNPRTKINLTDDEEGPTAQFRYPSPGSQPPVEQPTEDAGTMYEDPYVTSHYTRDTARRGLDPAFPNPDIERLKLDLLPEDDPRVQEAKAIFEEGAKSSPGNKGMFATGKSDYDPQGLRASMSASHEALNESLDANMPDHLPYPDWWTKQDEIIAWHKERGLPVPIGGTGWGTVPREGRIARW
mmetsp:Transcript_5161/g.9911  ORF Transcript_5161/g.9911 Transcript_5161/m.9911 type:complete len:267 (+) Transcript_5161:34-834(+)